MNKHTGQGQIIEANTLTQDKNGNWVPATPEPYYANFIEKILHFFGVHQWTYSLSSVNFKIPDGIPDHAKCVMCGRTYKKSNK